MLHPETRSSPNLRLPSVRARHPTPVLLPGKSYGQRSLVGCSPWGRYESGTNERLHFHFSLSCIGEGNSNPLQCSCLENPRDGEPDGLPSIGSHRVGHDWSDLAAAAAEHTTHYLHFPSLVSFWNSLIVLNKSNTTLLCSFFYSEYQQYLPLACHFSDYTVF